MKRFRVELGKQLNEIGIRMEYFVVFGNETEAYEYMLSALKDSNNNFTCGQVVEI